LTKEKNADLALTALRKYTYFFWRNLVEKVTAKKIDLVQMIFKKQNRGAKGKGGRSLILNISKHQKARPDPKPVCWTS
jgi:hypothetical protein